MAVSNEINYSYILKSEEINLDTNQNRELSTTEELTNTVNYDNFNKFISQIEIKLLRSIELYDIVQDDDSNEMNKEMQRNHIQELLSSANFLQTMLNWLILYLSRSLQPLNLEIMRLIPSVMS